MTGMSFGEFVGSAGELVVQPRMGFGDPADMLDGLIATKKANATTVGTVTLDSYTRVRDDAAARRALSERLPLNGFPIVAHGPSVTRDMISPVGSADFPVQVRHGSARPQDIFRTLVAAGLHATEGGPISYCLPYSRTPLRESLRHWQESCAILAETDIPAHLETFGGCMLGQLCPPSMLIAVSALEAMFFAQHGLRSVSLSYAQQTNPAQDLEAVLALRRLAARYLPSVDWHIVIYTYMGLYPETERGALALQRDAASLAVWSGASRLIVKTAAEAYRIPTVTQNVVALETAAAAARAAGSPPPVADTGLYAEARALVEAVLSLHPDIGQAMVQAFSCGYLDIPYCLHPDNAGKTRCHISADGRLVWSRIGSLPIGDVAELDRRNRLTSDGLLTALSYVRRTYDGETP
uniref:Putative glutamate mutase subumit E n=1 Tax=uncultured bacterium esnapd2 TaxID=1366601 RepID=S5TTR8_9BACT|nr:putative glutamate mutase subumit E [uncultured bacterium esnapd2]